MDNIFNTQKERVSTTFENMDLNFKEKGETQVARITLTYRFGKNDVKEARRRSTRTGIS